jgi:hypothetical protein
MSKSPDPQNSNGKGNDDSRRVPNRSSGIIQLHVESGSFVFTQNSKAIELTFDGCEFRKLGMFISLNRTGNKMLLYSQWCLA